MPYPVRISAVICTIVAIAVASLATVADEPPAAIRFPAAIIPIPVMG